MVQEKSLIKLSVGILMREHHRWWSGSALHRPKPSTEVPRRQDLLWEKASREQIG